jgi:hypothetical protein
MMDGIICGIVDCLSVRFDDPLVVNFLQTIISSDGRSIFTIASEN